jgi:hypothetical protein
VLLGKANRKTALNGCAKDETDPDDGCFVSKAFKEAVLQETYGSRPHTVLSNDVIPVCLS